jgi:gamma-glutamylcyclotransferase (GGCT)/AIG2-like uncharacterized protein YtfP
MPRELPLFAYGTLLSGSLVPEIGRLLRRRVTSLGPARLRGRLHDQGGYPGLVCAPPGGGWVSGEMLELEDPLDTLARLDRYEGFDPARAHAGEYVRVIRRVESNGGLPAQHRPGAYGATHGCWRLAQVPPAESEGRLTPHRA